MAGRISARARRNSARTQHLLGVLMLCAAVLGAAAIIRASREQKPREQPVAPVVGGFDTVSIPVPAEYVPAGKRMREVRFHSITFPAHQVPQGALTAIDEIRDSVATTALPANLPLFRENFSAAGGAVNPVVERIPPGMRAMTIRVDATSAVEGWAGSGSTVDVLLVERDSTTVVAEKVRVLSAERSVAPVEGAAAPSVPSTITLLVSQEQCLAINTAIPRGKIAFALRSTKDEESWQSTSFTAEKLKSAFSIPDKRAQVTGYVEVVEPNSRRSFALADGRWTRTERIPEGFLVDSGRHGGREKVE